ncbi:MAG: FAD-dependent oxidoreductase [Acidimicrobiales bacterium]
MNRTRGPGGRGRTPHGAGIGAAPDGSFDRATSLRRLADEEFDVLVIGGGITGAGVALDAASRGLRTALVERADFASGTSSKSSKMVHGGLRYLQQRELRLVYENLAERQRLLENAPHLVTPLPFLIPLFGRSGVLSRTVARSYATALWLYDMTGGLRIGRRHRRISREESLDHLPTLRTDRLVAGFVYFDARADDARLTLAILRTAACDHGAVAANYTSAVELLTDDAHTVTGARVRPVVRPGSAGSFGEAAEGPDFDVRASVVVNASGVWADDVRALDEETHPQSLRPAKGIHVTVPAALLPCDIAAVVPAPSDRRSIFVVPWPGGDRTYVGTTDSPYDGPLDRPTPTPEDVAYLLDAVNAATTTQIRPSDVTGVWAGLRPLLAPPPDGRHLSERTADLSRRHSVRTSAHGLVTVTGGKLTTYRKMAEDTMAAVVTLLGDRAPAGAARCATRRLRLRGAPGRGGLATIDRPGGLDDATAAHLLARYGTEAASVAALADGRRELLEPLVPGLPYLALEALYAVREEMAQSIEDILSRRTRALLEDARATAAAADAVAALVAPELGWAPEEAIQQAEHFAAQAREELDAAGVTATLGGRP